MKRVASSIISRPGDYAKTKTKAKTQVVANTGEFAAYRQRNAWKCFLDGIYGGGGLHSTCSN